MGRYKPGGPGHSHCLGMQQLQTNNLLKRVVNLMQNEFLDGNQKLFVIIQYTEPTKKGGNVEQCFQINICFFPGNTNIFHFKILNKKIC